MAQMVMPLAEGVATMCTRSICDDLPLLTAVTLAVRPEAREAAMWQLSPLIQIVLPAASASLHEKSGLAARAAGAGAHTRAKARPRAESAERASFITCPPRDRHRADWGDWADG